MLAFLRLHCTCSRRELASGKCAAGVACGLRPAAAGCRGVRVPASADEQEGLRVQAHAGPLYFRVLYTFNMIISYVGSATALLIQRA